jgi:hypothetical protein
METVNNIILLLIAVFAIINLVIEIEDVKTYEYEIVLKTCFGSVAVGALLLIFYKDSITHTFLYSAILVVLFNRALTRKKQNNEQD